MRMQISVIQYLRQSISCMRQWGIVYFSTNKLFIFLSPFPACIRSKRETLLFSHLRSLWHYFSIKNRIGWMSCVCWCAGAKYTADPVSRNHSSSLTHLIICWASKYTYLSFFEEPRYNILDNLKYPDKQHRYQTPVQETNFPPKIHSKLA